MWYHNTEINFYLIRSPRFGLELSITWFSTYGTQFYLLFHRKRGIHIHYHVNDVNIINNIIDKNDEIAKTNILYKNVISVIPKISLKSKKIIYELVNRRNEKYIDTSRITTELISEFITNKNIVFTIEIYKNQYKLSKIISIKTDTNMIDKIINEIPLDKNIARIISIYALHLVVDKY